MWQAFGTEQLKSYRKGINIFMDKVIKYIKENRLIDRSDRIVLGVSGGADSVCLLNILSEIKEKMNLHLCVVHVNHGIRGEEADEDEKFVKQMCEKMNVEYKAFHFDIPALALEKGMSEEEAGRHVRYQVFEQVAADTGADKIAVAHNANDSIETVLYNMCRGTGIRGVCGIPPKRDRIIRPILCLTRTEIEEYLAKKNIVFRTDSTNLIKGYTRNKIRLELLPYLENEINAASGTHILNLSRQLNEIENYMETQYKKCYMENVEELPEKMVIRIDGLKAYPDIIKREVVRMCVEKTAGSLKDITSEHIYSIMNIMDSNTGKSVNLPYGIVCMNSYGKCIMKKISETSRTEYDIQVEQPGEYTLENGAKLIVSIEKSVNFEEKMYTKWFDYDKIGNVIRLRSRKEGDYLEVADGKHKKLKSYFIDEKVPRELRSTIPVLADGSHIIWVVGYRISEKYKITKDTKRVLKVQYIGETKSID